MTNKNKESYKNGATRIEEFRNNQNVLSSFSFDGDSLPDYSEFDTESVTLDYFKER